MTWKFTAQLPGAAPLYIDTSKVSTKCPIFGDELMTGKRCAEVSLSMRTSQHVWGTASIWDEIRPQLHAPSAEISAPPSQSIKLNEGYLSPEIEF